MRRGYAIALVIAGAVLTSLVLLGIVINGATASGAMKLAVPLFVVVLGIGYLRRETPKDPERGTEVPKSSDGLPR